MTELGEYRPQGAVRDEGRRTELRCQVNHRHRYGGGPAASGRPCPAGDGYLEAVYTHCDGEGGCGCPLTDHNDGLGCKVCRTECGIRCRPPMRERNSE